MGNNDIKDFLKKESPQSKQHVHLFLEEARIFNLEKEQQFIETVKLVADIPWGKGRTIEEVLITKKVGTCTGKHLVLQACLDELGIKNKEVVCTFRWSEQGLALPEELQNLLDGEEWDHGHNFVQVEKEDGIIIDIDVNWDDPLKEYGFLTLPTDWDGKTSFIAVKMKERWDDIDMKTLKIQLIESLNPELRKKREAFLKGFIEWVDSLRD